MASWEARNCSLIKKKAVLEYHDYSETLFGLFIYIWFLFWLWDLHFITICVLCSESLCLCCPISSHYMYVTCLLLWTHTHTHTHLSLWWLLVSRNKHLNSFTCLYYLSTTFLIILSTTFYVWKFSFMHYGQMLLVFPTYMLQFTPMSLCSHVIFLL